MMPQSFPDLAIERLGPPTIESPLCRGLADGVDFFAEEDARALFDTVGYAGQHGQMPTHIDPVNLEVAGPRRLLYFNPAHTRAAIVTCGGVCPGINNVIRGLVRELCLGYGTCEVIGIRYGFHGMVPVGQEPVPLTPRVVDRIHDAGGAFLGTSRGPQKVADMVAFLKQRRIDVLFAIGGDGTQRGALEISRAARKAGLNIAVVGLPKTIDNDIAFVEKSFGFETAFSIADQALKAAHAEATSAYNCIGLVKLMGRHSGYITMLASLANGDVNFVLIPESPFQIDGPSGLLALLEKRIQDRGHAVIAVAEGAGQDLLADEAAKLGTDASGNPRLADIGGHLKRRIDEHFRKRGIPVNIRYIDPSYMIRSAPAVPDDAVFCLQLAQHAVHAALSGRTAMVVGIWKNTFTYVPMSAVTSERKSVDPHGPLWISLLRSIGQPWRIGDAQPSGQAGRP